MTQAQALARTSVDALRVQQDDTGQQLVNLWLHRRPPHTQHAYIGRFLAFAVKRCRPSR